MVPMARYRETNDELPRCVVKLYILTHTSSHPRSYRPACHMNKITLSRGVKLQGVPANFDLLAIIGDQS